MSQTVDAGDCKLKAPNESTKNEDEQMIESIVLSTVASDTPELTDPAILAVREIPKFRYSKDELIKLRETPMSKKKPDFINTEIVPPSIWDPEHWNDRANKRSVTPATGGGGGLSSAPLSLLDQQQSANGAGAALGDRPRRAGDPRSERLRKENDGIVLSPQRRSFNSGCFVPASASSAQSSSSSTSGPAGGQTRGMAGGGGEGGPNNGGHQRGVASNGNNGSNSIVMGGGNNAGNNTRRIGSGRIMRDFNNDKGDAGGENDYYRNNHQDDMNRRTTFTRRDYDGGMSGNYNNNKDNNNRRNGGSRYGRRISDKDEEPEWFSGGPSSQNDTIELRGFEEHEKNAGIVGKKKQPQSGGANAQSSASSSKRTRQQPQQDWTTRNNKRASETIDEKIEETAVRDENDARTSKGGGASVITATPGEGGATKGSKDEKEHKLRQANGDNDKENRNVNVPFSQGEGVEGGGINEQHFLFDDIFKCDTIPGLLSNGVDNTAGVSNSESRFSRWFAKCRESPDKSSTDVERPQQQQTSDSRRSSLHEEHLLRNLLNDLNDPPAAAASSTSGAAVRAPPQPHHPGARESYFAPISPAAVNTGAVASEPPGAPRPHQGRLSVADMFRKGDGGAQNAAAVDNARSNFPGKVMSLNELESRMRKGVDISGLGQASQSKSSHNNMKKDDDMSAFKRLLAQVSGGHVVTANNGMQQQQQKLPPMSLMEMLSHSQQQEEVVVRLGQQNFLGAGAGGNGNSPNSPKQGSSVLHNNDFLLKMQQAAQHEQHLQRQQQHQQVNMLGKLMGLQAAAAASNPHVRASPLLQQDIAQQQSKELLSRPEAQAILQGLKRGDITPQHLYQQLANPALQLRHREMLYAILKMQHQRVGPSPRGLSPVPPQPPHHIYAQQQQQQQQQLRVSPLPNGNKDSKILESSKFPQGRPVIGARIQQQQTPTNQWNNQYHAKQPGRPIVKANSTYPNPGAVLGAETFFNAQQQQQQLMFGGQQQQQCRQLQQQGGQTQHKNSGGQTGGALGQYGQQKTQSQPNSGAPSTMGNIGQYTNHHQSNQQTQQFPQLTQQQLRAQHQRPVTAASTGNSVSSQQPNQQQQKGQGFPSQQQQQQQHQNAAWQQFLNAAAQQTNRGSRGAGDNTGAGGGSGGGAGGDLSPTTTNQLARWFSSDLLERARGGELPSTAGLTQHSLEEIERQAAPPVRN